MAILDYLVQFADCPFVSDDARAYRLPLQGAAGASLSRQQPPRGLLDEIERIMPLSWLSEFAPRETLYDQSSLARQVQDTDGLVGVRVGQYHYPNTALRWSVFRGLATSSSVKAMLAATSGGLQPAAFKLNAEPSQDAAAARGRTYGIETELYLLPPRAIGEQAGAFDGLYLVTLVDERYNWQYRPARLLVDDSSTWDSLITALAALLGISVSYTAIDAAFGRPEPDSQLFNTHGDAAALLEAVANNVGRTLVRKYDGTYRLYTPAESLALALASRRNSQGAVTRLAGGDCFNSGTALPAGDLRAAKNAVLPDRVRVYFPKYALGDPVPHFVDRRGAASRWREDGYGDSHYVDVPLLSGGASLSGNQGSGVFVVRDAAKALYADEATALAADPAAALNQAGLTSLAQAVAGAYLQGQAATGLDESYPGVLAWEPDGLHDLLFTHSAHRRVASTRAVRQEWTGGARDMQHATPALSGGPASQSGSAGHSVALTVRNSGSTSGDVYMTNLLTFTGGGATVTQGVRTSGGVREAVITVNPGSGVLNSGDCCCSGILVSGDIYVYQNLFFNYYELSGASGSFSGYYPPSGISKLRVVAYSGATFHGFSSGKSGQLLIVQNAGSGAFTLSHDSFFAASGDRIRTPVGQSYTLWADDGVILEYDQRSGPDGRGRWRFDHPTLAGGNTVGFLDTVSGASSGVRTYGLRNLKAGSGLAMIRDPNEGGAAVLVAAAATASIDAAEFAMGGTAMTVGEGPAWTTTDGVTSLPSVTLPAAGTYLILSSVEGSISDSLHNGSFVEYQLYDSTNADQLDTRTITKTVIVSAGVHTATAALEYLRAAAGSQVIQLRARQSSTDPMNPAMAFIIRARITYVRIS